ncbi:hypothetical protein [Microbacterium sp. JZ101]
MDDDRLRRKYPVSAIAGGFDALWRPSAHEADQAWHALQIVPVPAPSPDQGPGVIDFDDGTVTIEIDE